MILKNYKRNSMRFLFIKLLVLFGTMHAATMRIYNKSNAPVQASVEYNDQGVPITAFSFGIYREPKKMMVTNTIAPNSSAYFDSGLVGITQISFVPSGGKSFNYNPNIGAWEVERAVEYYSPTDVRRTR